MSERIADSREEAGLPRYSEAAEFHHARREAGIPAEEDPPRDPHLPIERTIAAPGAGRGRNTLAMVDVVPPLFLPSHRGSEIGHAPGVVAFLGALQSPIRSLRISMVALI